LDAGITTRISRCAPCGESFCRPNHRVNPHRVYENLGLCWVQAGQPIRITPAGREYLKETGPSKVLDAHIWRYQFPNPLNDVDATKGISLFPHLVVVEMLLACDNYITNSEFVLFAARMKRSSEMAKGIERIKEWRKASAATQTEIIRRLATTKYRTIDQNSGFPLAFHRCDLLLDRHTDQLSVSKKNAEDLTVMLELYKGETIAVNFKDEADTIAFYGDPQRLPTKLEALDYYMDVSDVQKAVEVYRKLPEDVRGEQTPEEFEKEQFLEKHLEEYLEKHLDKIERGLKMLGRQYKTEVGPIDLYARATNGDLVVIELKKGRAADKVFGQICRYIGCIKQDHADEEETVRGFIVGRQVDDKLKYAINAVPAGLVTLQVCDFKGEKGKEDWIQIANA
jgi:Holliday junction resolvase-like predicted endonuclease